MNKLLLYLSCISAVIADMMLVYYAKKESHPLWLFITALVINTCGIFIWTYSMKKGIESATAITVYAIFTVAGCSFLGFAIFHEPLSLMNKIGLFTAIISLILISL